MGLKAASEEVDLLSVFQQLFPNQRITHGKAVCPFHSERTASLSFFRGTDGKQRYYCFGCDARGDILDLVQAAACLDGEKLDTPQALQRLGELTGKEFTSPKAQEAYRARKLQQERMNLCFKFFNQALLGNPIGKSTREWLIERGIPKETWERMPIGVYPPYEEIKAWAKKEGLPNDWLMDERLLIGAEKDGRKWHGALAFFYGQAFGEFSRIKLRPSRSKAGEARFLGAEEGDLGFLGLSHYRPMNGERSLLVEGEFDMLVPWAKAIQEKGQVPNIFCRSGSAGKNLSAMMALKGLGMGPPILLGDNDQAGDDWARELARNCRQVGMDASISKPSDYREKEDPAELSSRLKDIGAFEVAVLRGIKDPFRDEESSCPPLPESARLPDDAGKDACPWLDEYVEFSRIWSPRSYDLYHEACGLWLLSTVAARRVVTYLGKKCWTNLYTLLLGKTSTWKKTTATDIVCDLLEECELGFLLAPKKSSPSALIMRMKGSVPNNYGELEDEDSRMVVKNRLALSGRVGWYYEEFGGHLEEMLKPNGFMTEFRSMLREFDDCKPSYEYLTRAYGEEVIKNPYVAFLGALTPADLQIVEKQSKVLWGDGYFARYGIIVAPPNKNPCRERFPEGKREFPDSLKNPLIDWHKRLKMPEVIMIPILSEKGRETGKFRAEIGIVEETEIPVTDELRKAYDRYDDALNEISDAVDEDTFMPMYERLPTRALRISLIFASLGNEDQITLSHWAKAQEICERQRKSIHMLPGQIKRKADDRGSGDREGKVKRVIEKLGNPTAREIAKYAHISCQDAVVSLDFLVKAGEIERIENSSPNRAKVVRFSTL